MQLHLSDPPTLHIKGGFRAVCLLVTTASYRLVTYSLRISYWQISIHFHTVLLLFHWSVIKKSAAPPHGYGTFYFFILYKMRIPQPMPLLNRNCEGWIYKGFRGVCALWVCYSAVLITAQNTLWILVYKAIDSLLSKRYNKIAVDSFQQEGGATSAIHNRFSYLCCGRYSLLLYL